MLNFLATATGTWALWKLLDRLTGSGPGFPAAALDNLQPRLDNQAVGAELLNLGEPGSAVARAFQRIADAATEPGLLARAVEDTYAGLSREQQAAVSLALVMKLRAA